MFPWCLNMIILFKAINAVLVPLISSIDNFVEVSGVKAQSELFSEIDSEWKTAWS